MSEYSYIFYNLNMITVIGAIGAFLTLSAFVANQSNKLKNSSVTYDFINFAASTMLLIYAVDGKSYPFIAINIVWSLVSLKDVVIYVLKQQGISIKFKF